MKYRGGYQHSLWLFAILLSASLAQALESVDKLVDKLKRGQACNAIILNAENAIVVLWMAEGKVTRSSALWTGQDQKRFTQMTKGLRTNSVSIKHFPTPEEFEKDNFGKSSSALSTIEESVAKLRVNSKFQCDFGKSKRWPAQANNK